MHIAVFAEAPEAVGRAAALRGGDPFAEHAPEHSPESALAATGDVFGGEAGETGYTEVQELFDITRFGERMDLGSGLTGTHSPAAPQPVDPLPTVPAMTDRTADALAHGVRVLRNHPILELDRTVAELRERTRE